MSKQRAVICAALIGIALTGCVEREIEIKLVQTSDVHGNIFPIDFMTVQPTEGSLARVSTYLEGERRKYKDRLLYVDCGDIIQGTPLVYHDKTVDIEPTHIAAAALNSLGCLVGTLGNHEIETSINNFERFIVAGQHPVICANMVYENTDFNYLPPYIIVERGKVRIALIGMITPAVKNLLPYSLWEGFDFIDIEESARKWVPVIMEKENPDFIIGIFHSGLDGGIVTQSYSENATLNVARNVPGFDAILYGHSHIARMDKEVNSLGDTVLLINGGPYAKAIAALELTAVRKRGQVIRKSVKGNIVSMETYEPDQNFISAHSDKIESVIEYMDSTLGTLDVPISSFEAAFGPSLYMDYIHQTQLRITNAEISLASPVSLNINVEAGDFTVRDAFRLYPYENAISTLTLKGSEIISLLELSADRQFNTIKRPGDKLLRLDYNNTEGELSFVNNVYDFVSAAGIDYTVDVTKLAGNRVTVLSMSNGKPFSNNNYYRVAVNSFLASGGYNFFLEGVGIPREHIAARVQISTKADVRFHIITDFAIKAENGRSVTVERMNNWKIVPEGIAEQALSTGRLYMEEKR